MFEDLSANISNLSKSLIFQCVDLAVLEIFWLHKKIEAFIKLKDYKLNFNFDSN